MPFMEIGLMGALGVGGTNDLITWEAELGAEIKRQFRLYDIRHFYITYALANGADIHDLASRVGHKNINMIINVYTHLVEEMKSKAPFKIPSLLDDETVDNSDMLTNDVDQNEKEASD